MGEEISNVLAQIYEKKEEISKIKSAADDNITSVRREISPLKTEAKEYLEDLVTEVKYLARLRRTHVNIYFDGGPDWSTSYYISSEGELRVKRNYGRPETGFVSDVMRLVFDGNIDIYQKLLDARYDLTN